MIPFIGELAALGTSFLWSTSTTIFTLAGRQVGPWILNRLRLIAAIGLITLAHLLLGFPLPITVEPGRLGWLALSGVIGLTISDALLYAALVRLGARLAMLINALNPAIAAVLAWLFLGETLAGKELTGMLLALSGVTWVVLQRQEMDGPAAPLQRDYAWGVVLAFGSATGQALAMVTAKPGLANGYPALSATLIRLVAGALAAWALALAGGQFNATFARLREQPQVAWLILAGAIAGPSLGVTLSMLAIQNANIGVASTLMSLAPVILLPVGRFYFHERFGWAAVAGTVLTIAGVALLFMG